MEKLRGAGSQRDKKPRLLIPGLFFAFEVTRFLPVLYREVYDAESGVWFRLYLPPSLEAPEYVLAQPKFGDQHFLKPVTVFSDGLLGDILFGGGLLFLAVYS
jgi:hypothetical protein